MAAPTKHVAEVFSDTSLVAALSQVQGAWLDIGKRAASLFVTASNTGGTYVFEIDWSSDGGSSTSSTDTISTSAFHTIVVPGKLRFARIRVKNTHATNAFSAHSTLVEKDVGAGGAG